MKSELNILVVDDDKSIRDLFIRMLSEKYNITVAENGAKAINLLTEHPYDISFIDMRMPGLNGCETFAALRKIKHDITGIIMTGYTDKDLRLESFLVGAVKFLNKPFNIKEVRELLLNEEDFRKKN